MLTLYWEALLGSKNVSMNHNEQRRLADEVPQRYEGQKVGLEAENGTDFRTDEYLPDTEKD